MLTGIESISQSKAQEYRAAFFVDDTIPNVEVKETMQETGQDTAQETVKDIEGAKKLEQYSAYGMTLSEDGGFEHSRPLFKTVGGDRFVNAFLVIPPCLKEIPQKVSCRKIPCLVK